MKRKFLLAGGVVLAALLVLTAAALAPVLASLAGGGYAGVVNLNWGLDLPMEDACLYETDSGESFHGDGERYHVLEYSPDSGLAKALEREADPLAPSEEAVNEILDGLSVPAERRPDFSDCRWYAATHPTDSRNRLYLGLSGGGTTLCVIESFL